MKPKNQTGTTLVEFAIILPLLLILLFGLMDFGILLYNKAVITNASREAARYGIVLRNPKYTTAQVKSFAESYCSGRLISIGSSSPTATVTAPTQQFGDPLTVQLVYPYNYLVISRFLGWSASISLSSTTVMRYE
jgi:Flp pilus assembly protein TadG